MGSDFSYEDLEVSDADGAQHAGLRNRFDLGHRHHSNDDSSYARIQSTVSRPCNPTVSCSTTGRDNTKKTLEVLETTTRERQHHPDALGREMKPVGHPPR